jgi:outer membrane biosynthesis protein TonB
MLSWHKRRRLVLGSTASLCLIVAPSASFAEANIPDAAALTASLKPPLDALKEAQGLYSKELGMVSAMPGGSLAPREKAAKALEEIRSRVLQIRNSDKVPGDLMKDTLIAIDEAQTSLLTDGAQTIAYSLATVGQEIQAIESKLQPEAKAVQASSAEPAQTQPQQQSSQAKPEQQPQQSAANEPKAQPQPTQAQQDAQSRDQNKPAAAGQPSNEPASKPATAEAPPLSSAQLTSIENRQRGELVGKMLYDNRGDEVARIQDLKSAPGGKISAVEIDVGGFLGIGSRRIAVPVGQLEMRGDRIQAKSLTEDQIKNLPYEGQ